MLLSLTDLTPRLTVPRPARLQEIHCRNFLAGTLRPSISLICRSGFVPAAGTDLVRTAVQAAAGGSSREVSAGSRNWTAVLTRLVTEFGEVQNACFKNDYITIRESCRKC